MVRCGGWRRGVVDDVDCGGEIPKINKEMMD
jgi:hypothetical protein